MNSPVALGHSLHTLSAARRWQRCPYHRGLLRLPSKPKVVEFVLELELLQLAALTISYADLTISMESPNFDVAIQIANEQRGMAARVGWSGTIDRVWDDPSCRQNAQRL